MKNVIFLLKIQNNIIYENHIKKKECQSNWLGDKKWENEFLDNFVGFSFKNKIRRKERDWQELIGIELLTSQMFKEKSKILGSRKERKDMN